MTQIATVPIGITCEEADVWWPVICGLMKVTNVLWCNVLYRVPRISFREGFRSHKVASHWCIAQEVTAPEHKIFHCTRVRSNKLTLSSGETKMIFSGKLAGLKNWLRGWSPCALTHSSSLNPTHYFAQSVQGKSVIQTNSIRAARTSRSLSANKADTQWRTEGGCSTPPPRNSEGPPKSCQIQPNYENY